MKPKQFISTVLLLTAFNVFSAERITNFTTAKTIYDAEFVGEMVWVGTSGGLYYYNTITGISDMRPVTSSFPDPIIKALVRDEQGNEWPQVHRRH